MQRAGSLKKTLMLGKTEGRRSRGVTDDEMVVWHHGFNGHEFEHTLGDGEGQGSLACCSPWGCKESDTTERLNDSEDDILTPQNPHVQKEHLLQLSLSLKQPSHLMKENEYLDFLRHFQVKTQAPRTPDFTPEQSVGFRNGHVLWPAQQAGIESGQRTV